LPMDAVEWYYKRDDYHLSYYKVWKEDTEECLEIDFDISEGTAKAAIREGIKNILKQSCEEDKSE